MLLLCTLFLNTCLGSQGTETSKRYTSTSKLWCASGESGNSEGCKGSSSCIRKILLLYKMKQNGKMFIYVKCGWVQVGVLFCVPEICFFTIIIASILVTNGFLFIYLFILLPLDMMDKPNNSTEFLLSFWFSGFLAGAFT